MEDNFLKVAKNAAKEAGTVILKHYGKKHQLTIKTDISDIATQADVEAEKTIVAIIKKNFPDHNIIAEEKVRINNNSPFTWAIDPIDGTVSFAAGMPLFSVSIGLLENNEPILGVIYHVLLKDLYWAQKGKGAFLNGKKISVSKTSKLEEAVITLGIGSMSRRKEKLKDYFLPLIDKVKYAYVVSGGCVCMGLLAKGSIDAYPGKAWIWDQVAGGIIITEAGGKVTDRFGKSVDWAADQTEFIASNGLIHDELLEALK